MKKQLLFLFGLLLCCTLSYGQATAYPVSDLSICGTGGTGTFDLTSVTTQVLGGQSPATFEVSFHQSLQDAMDHNNLLAPANAYTGADGELIYVRVTNTGDNSFDVTSFVLNVDEQLILESMPHVTMCESFVLPPLVQGSYYTGPGGTGTMITAGTIITTTSTIYVYASDGACSAEESFTVTILQIPDLSQFQDIIICSANSYTLPYIPSQYQYQSAPGGAPIPAGTSITQNTTIYVQGSAGPCNAITSFDIIFSATTYQPSTLTSCGPDGFATFNFSQMFAEIQAMGGPAVEISVHLNMTDAENGVNALPMQYTNVVPNLQTVVLLIEGVTNCASLKYFNLSVEPCTGIDISGTVRYDSDANGCDATDMALPGVQVSKVFGNATAYAYTNAQGEYSFQNVQDGTNILAASANNIAFSPVSQILTINAAAATADFCGQMPNGLIDFATYFHASNNAIPGFTAHYQLSVINYGNTAAATTVNLAFDETKLNFLQGSVSPTAQGSGLLTFAIPALPPFQVYSINLEFAVEIPPTVISGTILSFVSTVDAAGDSNGANNIGVLNQTAVNSYDPNDITCHEGDFITPTQADGYLHYTIRFQNMGTAPATNIRVENTLSDKLDWTTFRPISASHGYLANRFGNQVTFSFNEIGLPAEQDDEPGSHGYVMYQIKPIEGIEIGNSIENSAGIYFDFNPAILTNTATTTVQLLSAPQPSGDVFVLYPNPTSGMFTIKAHDLEKVDVEVCDARGASVLSTKLSLTQSEGTVNVAGLASGLYFVKIASEKATSVKKLMIK